MTIHLQRPTRLIVAVAVLAASAIAVANAGSPPIRVGAVYPTGGSHGRGGIDEQRGVELAVERVNASGGIDGRKIELVAEAADRAEEAADAVRALVARGVPVVLGSYGSTISQPAAEAAEAAGVVFWETGAVGMLSDRVMDGSHVFRFPPTGGTLGRSAVTFARRIALPKLDVSGDLRYGVTYVDDVYGRSVGEGAIAELRDAGIEPAGVYPYRLDDVDYGRLVGRMRRDRIDVLFVSSYLSDGIEIRRETVRQLDLVASVGTSSSYCMHEFGEALGADAVGLFASDKPDGHVLDPSRLSPEAAEALVWARDNFEERYDHEMTAPALTGFAAAIALFEHVLPAAEAMTAPQIAAAAREIEVPLGALPNGSGLNFPPAGAANPVDNLRATSVIWEWVAPGTRAVVHPPAFATQPVVPLDIA